MFARILDTAHLWRYGIRKWRGNVACCRRVTQYIAKLGSAESSVDDFVTCRGDVLIRAVTILRYIESQPLTGRFVNSFERINKFQNFFSHYKHLRCAHKIFWKFIHVKHLRYAIFFLIWTRVILKYILLMLKSTLTLCDFFHRWIHISWRKIFVDILADSWTEFFCIVTLLTWTFIRILAMKFPG